MNRVERYKRRCLRRCTKLFLGTLILCTAFNVVADYQIHKDLEQVKYQQQDTLNMIMEHRQEVEIVTDAAVEGPELISLDEFEITYYCAEQYPHICNNGKNYGYGANGEKLEVYRSIGVDPDVIPYGTEVVIDGKTYIAQDTGGEIQGKRIDIYVQTHEEALQLGRRKAEVYIWA